MDSLFKTRSGSKRLERNSDPDPVRIQPYGPYGAGLITAHPVGLLIVAAVAFVALWGLPEARWFSLGSVVLGVVLGLLLWLKNR